MEAESEQIVETHHKYLLERVNFSYLLDFSTPKNQRDFRGAYHNVKIPDFGQSHNPLKFVYNPLKFMYDDILLGIRYTIEPIFLDFSFDHIMEQFENPRHRIIIVGKPKNKHFKPRKGVITLESLTFKEEANPKERRLIYPFEWYPLGKPKTIKNNL
ncbi:MAG: hypothetical protein AABX29_00725 [Nanoarchaeota archaeon]